MSKGGGSSSGTTQVLLDPNQQKMIQAQTGLFTNTIEPNYQTAVQGATNLYNQEVPYVTNALQNAVGVQNQAQNVLGSTGQQALTAGQSALQNIASPEYQQMQINAALRPAQAQYAQNLANQQAQFGGAGNLGSSREALANQQLANSAQAQQEAAVAQALQGITGQQLQAGSSLANLGLSGLQGAQTAAQNQVQASLTPQQLYNQYASVLYGAPSASYSPNFAGTQGSTTSGNTSNWSLNGNSGVGGGILGGLIGSGLALL